MKQSALVAAILVAAGVVVASALACAPDDRNVGPFPKERAANAVKPTDKRAEGQWYFLHETWGTEQGGDWPPADFMLDLMKNDPGTFGNQYENFGFLADPDDDFPIGLKRGTVNKKQIRETCALCHVAELPDGTRWFGAPNTKLDFGAFRVAVDDRWVATGHESLLDERTRSKLLALGPGRIDASTGSFPKAVPAGFPVYFELGKETALNYIGTGENIRTEATFSIYSAGAGQKTRAGVDIPFPSDDKFNAFLAFFSALEPPPAPAEFVHDARVGRGRDVFHEAKCDACHHLDHRELDGVVPTPHHDVADRLPGEDPAYPRGTIGTDRLHRVLIDGTDDQGDGNDDGYFDMIMFVIERGLAVQDSDGYRTNSLRALWLTAPYLHNDSVPTLEDLFAHAGERPSVFQRGDFTVNTFADGNGNGGHEFGVDLSNDDKAALVAFLKTL